MMREQKPAAPLAETEREGLVERPHPVAPGQRLIMVATAGAAALLILVGVAGRNNYFGLFGAAAPSQAERKGDGRPLAAPQVSVPLALAASPPMAEPTHVACPGGLRLPIGMNCPEPEKAAELAQPSGQAGQSEEERVRERRRKSAIGLAVLRPGSATAPPQPVARPQALADASSMLGQANALSGALVATTTPSTRASIQRNPSMTLGKGTLPDCTLLTAIQTDQPGFLKCLLSAPVLSMDGKVVLMEAGTTLEGEYAQGPQTGQSTIFTLWSRAVTPHFVTIQLNSPGADALGRAGTSGEVDNRWFERFAGAVLFSVFEDAKELYVAREDARASRRANASAAHDTYNIGSQGSIAGLARTDSTTQAIVEEMLKQGSQVKPRLYKHQGEIVRIFVARDVDFSTVYALRPVTPSE